MNILALLPEEIGNASLTSVPFYFHARAWAKSGHLVTLLIPSKEKSGEENIAGIRCIYKKANPFSLRLSTPLSNFIYGQEYDLIVEYWSGMPFFSPLYSKAKKLIFLENADGLRDYRKLQLAKLYKNADFLVTGDNLAKMLLDLDIDNKKITVIPKGISVNAVIHPKSKMKTLLYISSGFTASLKILDIFSAVERRDDSWKYLLVENDLTADTKSVLQQTELSLKVQLFQNIGERKIHELISQSWLFLILQAGDINYDTLAYAGFSGTPVISYRFPELKEFVDNNDNGILLKDQIPEALVKEILYLGSDEKQLKQLSLKTRKFGNKYTWNYLGNLSCKLIESL